MGGVEPLYLQRLEEVMSPVTYNVCHLLGFSHLLDQLFGKPIS